MPITDVKLCDFGYGDIAIGGGVRPETQKGVILLEQLPEKFTVGEELDPKNHYPVHVQMRFPTVESLDVLIDIAQQVRKKMLKLREEGDQNADTEKR